MFDPYGRILCIECLAQMITIRAKPEEAMFRCSNPSCAHIAHYRWGRPPRTALQT